MQKPLAVSRSTQIPTSGNLCKAQLGRDGITATIETAGGTTYKATIGAVTSEILYTGTEKEIQEGTVPLFSGDLLDLGKETIAPDRVVVNPEKPVDPD